MRTTSLSKSRLSRRTFIRTAAAGAAALSFPMVLPSRLFGHQAPSKRIRVGQIGCGRIAQAHDLPGVFRSGLADIVAVCDVDAKRVADGKGWVEKLYTDSGTSAPDVSAYGDFRELLARDDIDAVVISTPEHWHAELGVAAALAGKDIYVQKPFTLTHAEGVVLRDVVAKQKRILQVGSQQRSWGPNQQFRKACEFIRSGRIGLVRRVEIGLPIDPTQPDPPEQPIPSNLDYDMWLGPTAEVYYTETRVHPQVDYSRPGWLRNESYCLGMITGWGSHHLDTLHWALDCELSGPSKIVGSADFPKNTVWNVHGAYDVKLTYPGDVHVHVSDRHPTGLKFIGDEGWLWVTRDGTATSSDPTAGAPPMPILDASDPSILEPERLSVYLPPSDSHHRNWLECVISREQPLAPAPVAHRSGSACIVSWIAMKLGRELTWDAKAERFVNDDEANAMLSRPERAPYGALRLGKA